MALQKLYCTECRRRKVRCIFGDGEGRCQQCIAHAAQCISQDTAGPNPGSNETEDLRARVANMEEMLRTLTPSTNSPGYATQGSDTHMASDHETGVFVNAPLVQFLRDGLTAQLPDLATQPSRQLIGLPSPANPILHLIPTETCLRRIFQSTHRFWSIWPLASVPIQAPETGFPQSVEDAIRFVGVSLSSGSSGVVAKCLAWLCLCIQQLPKDFEEVEARLPLRAKDLISSYLERIDSIVVSLSPPASDTDCIEAMVLQYKLFVNMGRPQRAWKCTRNALDNALLLGLHRSEGTSSTRRSYLWTTLWHQDRHLALFLGLPYTVPEQHIMLANGNGEATPDKKVLHQLNMICGYIIDRDQSHHRDSGYSSTARIVEEMEILEDMIPKDWATSDLEDGSTPLGVPFWRRATVLLFHLANQHVHLPFAATAIDDKKHAYSRYMVLKSAENILQAHEGIRAYGGVPIICDFLDFCAFNAALLLAVSLMSENSQRSSDEAERLWGMVTKFTAQMRQTADVLECSVAAQSAQVLEHIFAAYNGQYEGPERYKVTIPFFGHFQTAEELGADWCLDTSFFNTYNWNETFEFTSV
ncbi:hypothetical protein B0I35DRAFT_454645 [Stachybotrys elegans]|uniref:Zn(2)-C6 fungal-type domain-containing protein n=1 Tax=Stachybotrys elegans TaxID=80388 RepID=A0A8K0SIP5_9HYPO|nr:hypothetical protein B0I35DRAFT_454645 [Stachybotrys elegans]